MLLCPEFYMNKSGKISSVIPLLWTFFVTLLLDYKKGPFQWAKSDFREIVLKSIYTPYLKMYTSINFHVSKWKKAIEKKNAQKILVKKGFNLLLTLNSLIFKVILKILGMISQGRNH